MNSKGSTVLCCTRKATHQSMQGRTHVLYLSAQSEPILLGCTPIGVIHLLCTLWPPCGM